MIELNTKTQYWHDLKTDQSKISTFSFFVYIYFVVDYFLHFSARIPFYGSVRPTVIVFCIIAISLVLQYRKYGELVNEPIFKAVLALIFYIIISLPLVEWPGSVVRGNFELFVKAVSFFFFTAIILDSKSRLKIFLMVFLCCQVYRILEPLYLHFTTGYWGSATHLDGAFANRLSGAPADVVNPNGLGFVIVTVIPFLHYLLFYSNKKGKFLYALLLPLLIYALILTMSRGAFIALLVVAWIFFYHSKHKFALILVGCVIMVASWSVMTPVQKDRYLSLFDRNAASAGTVAGRTSLIVGEFVLGFQRPIVGHGLGTTAEAKYHNWGISQASHNLYGQLLIEIGMVGFILFFIFLLQTYKRLTMNCRILESTDSVPDVLYCRLNQAMFAVFWMYAVYSLNYFGLSQYYWYLFGGLAVAFGRNLNESISRISASVQADV